MSKMTKNDVFVIAQCIDHIQDGCIDHLASHIILDYQALGIEAPDGLVMATVGVAAMLMKLPPTVMREVLKDLYDNAEEAHAPLPEDVKLTTTKVAQA